MDNKIKYEGILDLGGFTLPCYVLGDGTRILSGRGMQEALKMVDNVEGQHSSGTRLTRYLDQKTLKPFIFKDKELDHFAPIICYKGEQKINGYEASILIDICDGFLEARKHIQLSQRQSIIAEQCEILVRSFAKVGLIALIDKATGIIPPYVDIIESDGRGFIEVHEEEIEPIEITSQILIQNGFNKVFSEFYEYTGKNIRFTCVKLDDNKRYRFGIFTKYERLCWVNIQYIHQLQNICSLVNKELEIRL